MDNVKPTSLFKFAIGISLTVISLQYSSTTNAQDEALELEEVVITGSRITQPGVVSASPIASISAKEIGYLQEAEIEKSLHGYDDAGR